MVTLAGPVKPIGEVLVSGNTTESSTVTVNGEPAKSGRTVFAASTISTPDTSGATINLGKTGKLQLAPNSTFVINTDGDAISGDLTAGSITVLNSLQSVGVKTLSGEIVSLSAGESATATSTSASKMAQTTSSNNNWTIWALIIGGAIVAVTIAVVAADDGDDDNRVVSPVR